VAIGLKKSYSGVLRSRNRRRCWLVQSMIFGVPNAYTGMNSSALPSLSGTRAISSRRKKSINGSGQLCSWLRQGHGKKRLLRQRQSFTRLKPVRIWSFMNSAALPSMHR